MPEKIKLQYHSIQDIVFSTLRDEIVNQVLKPGDVLNTVELSKRLGVSRTPIREALNRLVSIGLIEESPHKSCYVKKLSIEQVIEIYYIRAALSGAAARLAATKISKEDQQKLLDLCNQMENINEPDPSKSMLKKNREFHNIIIAAAKSPNLENLLEQYYQLSQHYRALALEFPDSFRQVCSEHRKIAEAMLVRDKNAAESSMREHYMNTARRIAKAFHADFDI
ncbi:MAG: GntR family transcriptional regulator [Spirochaetota bacterium]|jgi:DNA-binding GntR family transcriptional regulator